MLGAKKIYGRNEKRPIEILGEALSLRWTQFPLESSTFEFHLSVRWEFWLVAVDFLNILTTFYKNIRRRWKYKRRSQLLKPNWLNIC